MKTICIVLTDLYRRAREDQKPELEEAYVMAKKMNKRLQELNGTPIPESEIEESWRRDIRNSK